MIKGLKQLVDKRIRLFRKAFGKDVLIFLGFLIISLFFWTLQAMQEIRTFTLDLPVVYEPVPGHITITNTLPATLKVTLRDKGMVLHQYYMDRKQNAIRLNPMEWYKKEGIGRVDRLVIESQIRRSLNSTTELISLYPDTLSFFYVEKAGKPLKVVVNHDLSPSPQYLLTGDVMAIPSTITAYAPESMLEAINTVETNLLRVEGLKESKAFNVRLVPREGVRYSQDEVTVQVNVEAFTEKIVTVPIQGVGFPEGERLLAFPSSVRISFLVGLSAYDLVKESDFEVGVSYDSVLGTDSKLLKPRLIRQPAYVKRVKVQPESVECLIEKR